MLYENPFQPDNPYRKLKVIQAEGGREPIPPFEIGDIVKIIPYRGCNIDGYYCNIELEVEMCERAAVEPEIVWDIDLIGCPFLIIYPLPDGEDYTLIPIRRVRDQVI